VGGEPKLNEETTDVRFFPVAEAVKMDLFHGHWMHILDALAGKKAAFIR
jgi:hypothetical protein